MVVKTHTISKARHFPGIDIANNWQRIKFSPCPTPAKRREAAMNKESSVPERPETATLEKPSILDPNLSKKIDMTVLSRENLKYVNNLVVKPIAKKASLEEQTQALHSLTAGLNTISGPNSLIITSPESKLKSGPKTSSFNPVSLDSQKSVEPKTGRTVPQTSPSHPPRGKTLLLESKPKITPKKPQEETSSKLSKLYKVINKNYRIRGSFRRAKDKSNTSRSSSRCDAIGQEESKASKEDVKADAKNEKPNLGKVKKSGKRPGHKEKKSEIGAQKTAVRKPFAAKFKGRSRSLKRSEETGKSNKEEKDLPNSESGLGLGPGPGPGKAENLKFPGCEKLETKKERKASPSSQIPVRKAKEPERRSEGTASGPSSLTAQDLHPVTRDFENGYSLTEWIPVPPSSGRKPRLITCRFCSREFGTASFPVHEPRCMRIWLGEHNKNNKINESSNETTTAHLDQGSASASPQNSKDSGNGCEEKRGRTKGEPPRAVTGRKLTDGAAGSGSAASVAAIEETVSLISVTSSSTATPATATARARATATAPAAAPAPGTPLGRRPPTVPCHICNREFGSKSIAIHEPQCRWKLERDKQGSRKHTANADKENKLLQDSLSDDSFWESHRQQLIACKKCGRTFNPDRVVVHERSCKGRIPKKK